MDKSFTPIENELANGMGKTAPELRFTGGCFSDWQKNAREKLFDLLGLDRFSRCENDRFTVTETVLEEDHEEIHFRFMSEDGYYLPCVFVTPKKKAYDAPPLMICLEGHNTGMHNALRKYIYEGDQKNTEDGDRDFALQAVEHGFCALAIEQRAFGINGGKPSPDCYGPAMTALLTGRTLLGGRVWDVSRAIDAAIAHFGDRFDSEKIYCMGNSGGGTATLYSTACDERIKAAICSCAFCSYENSIGNKYHCACNYVPRIACYFDMSDLAGLVAPRPLLIVSGKDDGIFPAVTAAVEYERLRDTYYSAAGAKDKVLHYIGSEGHRFYKKDCWPMFLKISGEEDFSRR